jgi:hypothetical protein
LLSLSKRVAGVHGREPFDKLRDRNGVGSSRFGTALEGLPFDRLGDRDGVGSSRFGTALEA